MVGAYNSFWEEGRGQEHAVHFGKSMLGCLGVGPRLSLFPFWVIL